MAERRGGDALALASGGLPGRYWIVLACFLATFTCYVDRVGFSIAYTPVAEAEHETEALKGAILSAFYYGYSTSQIPGGWAAARFGSQRTLLWSFVGWAGVTTLLPLALARPTVLSGARALVGCAQGLVIPSVHTTLAQWIPANEKARAVSLSTSGMYLGSTLAMAYLPGLVAAHGPVRLIAGIGALGLAWVGFWLYVLGREAHVADYDQVPVGKGKKAGRVEVPWGELLRQPAVWAICANNFTFHYVLYVLMNWLPTYFEQLLHAELSHLGLIKTLPYLFMFLFSNVGGVLGDWLVNRRSVSVRGTRVLINSAGFAVAAGAVAAMPYATTSAGATGLLTATLAALGLARGGFSVNHMDVAPKYAGIVMGISNTCGTVAGIIGVSATGVLLERGGGSDRVPGWTAALNVCSGLCLVGALVFYVFAQGLPVVS